MNKIYKVLNSPLALLLISIFLIHAYLLSLVGKNYISVEIDPDMVTSIESLNESESISKNMIFTNLDLVEGDRYNRDEYRLIGTITNKSDSIVEDVFMIISLNDKDGKLINCFSDQLFKYKLKPGVSMDFHIDSGIQVQKDKPTIKIQTIDLTVIDQ